MRSALLPLVALLMLGAGHLSAQAPDPTQPYPASGPAMGAAGSTELAERLSRLEAENQRMQVELQQMREHAVRLPPVTAVEGAAAADTIPAPPESVIPAAPTMAQVQSEAKKFAWTKGDFKVVPYGYLWGNMVYQTERMNPGSYALFVQPPSIQDHEHEFIVDARNTRLGIDVAGPRVPFLCCAPSGGKVEIDFQGGFPNVSGQENKPTILLRHAYLEVKNEDFRLLAGQTWDVISPLYPGMLMYSVGWDAGNIGYRRAQFRAERYLAFSDDTLLTVQGSANQNALEFLGTSTTSPKSEPASWPILEGRVAVTLGERKGPCALPITFGVSGHVGNEQYDNLLGVGHDLIRPTWSCNADLRIPLTSRFGFQAELFTGENLDAFLGGIGQSIDPTTFQAIHSTGGWGEFWYDWTPCLHSHFGYLLDDPDNNNLHTTAERTYNQVFFTNVVYDLTKQFQVGLEVSQWRTDYLHQAAGESTRFEFMAKYGF
jgi:hypothetical protein